MRGKKLFLWRKSSISIVFQGPCAIIPSCYEGLFKYQNISGSMWKHSFHMLEYSKYRNISGPVWEHSFLICGNIQISEYFRARMGTFLSNMREYSNIGIFQGPWGTFLPNMREYQILEYFRARVGAFLSDMREYSNIGIFQGPCGNISSWHAEIFKYRNISGPVWEDPILPHSPRLRFVRYIL